MTKGNLRKQSFQSTQASVNLDVLLLNRESPLELSAVRAIIKSVTPAVRISEVPIAEFSEFSRFREFSRLSKFSRFS